jgi:hypothetical protein
MFAIAMAPHAQQQGQPPRQAAVHGCYSCMRFVDSYAIVSLHAKSSSAAQRMCSSMTVLCKGDSIQLRQFQEKGAALFPVLNPAISIGLSASAHKLGHVAMLHFPCIAERHLDKQHGSIYQRSLTCGSYIELSPPRKSFH